nr:MAG TPA: hypothetical protein [Caudoviricetes sp.]
MVAFLFALNMALKGLNIGQSAVLTRQRRLVIENT